MASSKLASVLCALALAGCAEARIIPVAVTPELITYTREQQQEVADELDACADCDMTETFITDYGKTREAIRAAQED